MKVFGERVRELGYRARKASTVFYLGLRLKPEVEELDDLYLINYDR